MGSSGINDSGRIEYLSSGLCLDVEDEDDDEEKEGEIVYLDDHDKSMYHEYSVRQKYVKFYDSDNESEDKYEDDHEDDEKSIENGNCDAESTHSDMEEFFEKNCKVLSH